MKKGIEKLLVSIFSIICVVASAQVNENQNPVKLKLYMNGFGINEVYDFTGNSGMSEEGYMLEHKSFIVGAMSIGLEFGKNEKLKQEIELLPLCFDQQNNTSTISNSGLNSLLVSGENNTAITSGLRYQVNYYILSDRRVNPYLGVSSQLLYEYFRNNPVLTPPFVFKSHDIGLLFSVTPGVEIELSNLLSLNLNVPFSLFDFKFNSDTYYSPSISEERRKKTDLTTNLFPKRFNFRIGLSCRI